MLNILIKEKRYSDKLILENIQFSIPQNGLYGVVGKNGVGKTTFFKCLCSLTPFKGEISYQQQFLTPQQIGFLPTEPYLYEHLTVEEFYKFYSLLLGIKPQNAMPFEVNKTLLIKELSTGMRKKVYFNAVLQKPYALYIFNEPFSGLDITSVLQIKKLLKKLSETHIVPPERACTLAPKAAGLVARAAASSSWPRLSTCRAVLTAMRLMSRCCATFRRAASLASSISSRGMGTSMAC